MSREDNSTAVIIIAGITLAIVGWWVHGKVVSLSDYLGLDTASTYSIIKRVAVVAVGLGIAAYIGWFKKVLPYLAVALFMCALPALNYWSWGYVIPEIAMGNEQAWYGWTWIQVVTAIALGSAGYFISERDN